MPRHKAARNRMTPGSGIASRYNALQLTHHSLDEKLAVEMKRPLPDFTLIQRMKRRKLLLKDEMASIERLLDAMGSSRDGATDAARVLPKTPSMPQMSA